MIKYTCWICGICRVELSTMDGFFKALRDRYKQIKRLEKSYNTRYHASLMGNSKMVKEQGMAVFLAQ